MKSRVLFAAILAVLLGGAGLAIRANATPAQPGGGNDLAYEAPEGRDGGGWDEGRDGAGRHFREGGGMRHGRGMMGHRGMAGRRMMGLRAAKDPQLAAIRDLRLLEGAYRHSGREKDVASIYADVLKRTSDPVVRDFANHRLARIAMRGGDQKGAIDRLHQSLEDDLKRLK
jgi:hypothetical protein